MFRKNVPMKSATRSRAGGLVRGVKYAGLISGTALLLASCAVGPDYQTPNMPLSSSWRNANADTPSRPPELAFWWKKLGDPLLNQLIEEAIENNLDVRSSKASVRGARASYRQANGALFPSLDGSAGATRSKSASSGGSSSTVGNLFNAGFDASWELDLFGANRRASEAAKYGLDAAEEELRATLLTLIGDVTTNYVEARGYQARIALAQRTAASQNETAKLTRNRFQVGSSSGLDVANAEGQAASTSANIPTLQTALAASVHRLGVLTGREPTALTDRMKRVASIPTPRLPMPSGVPATVLLTRPDVRLAERQLAQSTALIGAAEAAKYPAISLTGSIGTSAAKFGDLGKNSSISWSFGPTLSVPIFNAGKLAAAADLARAERDQSFLAYKGAVLGALEDVENALVGFSHERVRLRSLQKSTDSYRSAASLSQSLYQTGAVSFLDVLDSERSLYSAEDSLIQSKVLLTTYYISLQKALGGGWSGEVDTTKPEVVDQNAGPRLALTKAETKAQ
ncbi:efflux transporter outer membrane subunit [Roseibium suaedae]|uniref:Efflux transporter, outer membrane factor (OMF) lipoprotein, NodT family n=1 Tax=Roseibium suaedae TaxID=735517 RepID=A0A1M7I537_9HYPH|nr:efflux transporter outer membrane subunit [Roseibium suaedae]SHM35825.1 efflux transporter, outer membrane factor (OMF) lipoprotein, NodT family [Roseibium suaedae]